MAEAEAERFKVEALAEAEANKTRFTGQRKPKLQLVVQRKPKPNKRLLMPSKNMVKQRVSMVMEMLPQLMKEAAQHWATSTRFQW